MNKLLLEYLDNKGYYPQKHYPDFLTKCLITNIVDISFFVETARTRN